MIFLLMLIMKNIADNEYDKAPFTKKEESPKGILRI